MKNKVLQRIREFIKLKRLTIKAFSESIGVSENTFKTMFSRDSNPNLDLLIKISNEYPDFPLKWIIKGERQDECVDESTINYEVDIEQDYSDYRPLNKNTFKSNYMLIPLINMDVVGGVINEEMDVSQYVEKYIPFVDAKKNDIACPVTNNSMFPVYPAGCIVQIRKIELWKEYIEYGQVYVVDLVDGRRLIKEIRKSNKSNCFLLHSYNNGYDDNDIPLSMIYSMWLVVAKYER